MFLSLATALWLCRCFRGGGGRGGARGGEGGLGGAHHHTEGTAEVSILTHIAKIEFFSFNVIISSLREAVVRVFLVFLGLWTKLWVGVVGVKSPKLSVIWHFISNIVPVSTILCGIDVQHLKLLNYLKYLKRIKVPLLKLARCSNHQSLKQMF